VIDTVEELLQINIHYDFVPFAYIHPRLFYGLMRAAAGPKSVAAVGELFLEYRG
jgi:hypothetical protein